MKKGVLLVNMGGAGSAEELKIFLARMFRDPFILPFGKAFRYLLSFIISNTRYKKSWKKYELIGGSPIIEATYKTQSALQDKLGERYMVNPAFSYSSPFIKESIEAMFKEEVNEIIVLPLYPQASYTTTSSVEKDVMDAIAKKNNIKIHFIKEFFEKDGFIRFWSDLILEHVRMNNYTEPYLLFSAHSIPAIWVEKGDRYPVAIKESAKLIAERMGYHYEVAFQSGMKGSKWVGPDVKERLKDLADKGKEEIVIIPISFVNENLETLYDLDYDIVPFAKNEAAIKKISRVNILVGNCIFIDLLAELIKTKIKITNTT